MTETLPPPGQATIDLNKWHHALHQVTGEMALLFNRATDADLARWAAMLRAVVQEMETDCAGETQQAGIQRRGPQRGADPLCLPV